MAISRFLIGGLASALLLTGGVFIWKGYSQVAEEAVLPDPPPALPAIPRRTARRRRSVVVEAEKTLLPLALSLAKGSSFFVPQKGTVLRQAQHEWWRGDS